MKKGFSRTLTAFIIVASLLTVFAAADSEYTTADDPLVSLSYVNDVLGPEIAENVMKKIEADYVKAEDIANISGGNYTAVSLSKGQTVMAKGVCEIIITEGSATALITSATNIRNGVGISDLTAGNYVINGSPLLVNHYLVIPKADGRGLTAASDNVNILIRGEYNIAK
ncbi:MAG: hypothetical protein KBT31_06630 [Firmicutes bacterium]|nr:hypothetical protein [Candidatus Colimorpha enterica]